MKRHHYRVDLRWQDARGTVSYRRYTRRFEIGGHAKPTLAGSADPAFLGEAERYNPEELLLAALSGCHLLWYLHLCADAGVVVVSYRDEPSATMEEDEEGEGAITSATLSPAVTITQASDQHLAVSLHDEAARRCFIARSVTFPVRHRPTVERQVPPAGARYPTGGDRPVNP
jgi:organic hydroperoxide reductase OsmC/OhrA